MNFYELQAFVALSEELHFGRAASKLNLSPSALSRIITRLEEEANSILVDRSNRQVSLTADGKIFLKYAQESIQRRNQLTEQLSGQKEKIIGSLHLYASVTACYTVLPEFLKKFTELYPEIQLSIETGDPAGAIEAVRAGRAAMAVAAIPESGVSQMDTFSVVKTPLVYAAAKNSQFVNLEGSPQDIISTVPLILPKTGLARVRFEKWIKSRNVKPTIIAETEGNEAIMALVQMGLGIGLVPQIVLDYGPYKGEYVSHSAGNSMGYYDVGFIRKAEITGTTINKRIQEAVSRVLKMIYN
ncbi:MAG: HTH-type transcriptional activator IlvY [Treponema sp.]|nr:HTH-type transcriptional activator IlvY [Treponema sp.]